VYDSENSEVPRKRECKREKNDDEIYMWERREKTGIGRKEKKEGVEMRERNEGKGEKGTGRNTE
jgi:hypothetical protein